MDAVLTAYHIHTYIRSSQTCKKQVATVRSQRGLVTHTVMDVPCGYPSDPIPFYSLQIDCTWLLSKYGQTYRMHNAMSTPRNRMTDAYESVPAPPSSAQIPDTEEKILIHLIALILFSIAGLSDFTAVKGSERISDPNQRTSKWCSNMLSHTPSRGIKCT